MVAESLNEVVKQVARELARSRLPFYLTGMYAGSWWLADRAYRATFDVDISVVAPIDRLPGVIARLSRAGWEVVRDLPDLVTLRQPGGIYAIDLLPVPIAGGASSPEETALARFFEGAWKRCVRATIAGTRVRIARPEDIAVVKVLLDRAKDAVDLAYLNRIKGFDRGYFNKQLRDLDIRDRYVRMAARATAELERDRSAQLLPRKRRSR